MKIKRTLLLMSLMLSLLLSGCDYQAIIDSAVMELAHQLTEPEVVVEPFIGFSEEEVEDTDLLLQLKPEQLQNYTSEFSDYNSYTYYKYLNDTEKLLYHAYEYALDHSLPYFYVDDRLLQDMERSAFDVLEFLALDSAVVEQNVSLFQGSYTTTYTKGTIQTVGESYTTVLVENFAPEMMKNKRNAILKARIVLSKLMDIEMYTDREIAEYLYDYLGGCVGYKDEIESEEYLYSALCEGWTNCDGYANAFALMCRLADIPCIEVNSDTPEGEVGHTWNMICLEGRWVHVDATGAGDDVYSVCENCCEERVNFGYSDALLSDRVLYADLLPTCPEGLSPVLHIPSGESVDFNETVKKAFQENGRKFVTILVDEGDLEKQISAGLPDVLECDLHYIYYETAEGKMVYYLFNNDE